MREYYLSLQRPRRASIFLNRQKKNCFFERLEFCKKGMYNNFLRRLYLFSVIDSLHPGRNRSENFIRDCIEFFCDFGDGQLLHRSYIRPCKYYLRWQLVFRLQRHTLFHFPDGGRVRRHILWELPLCGNREIIHLFFRTLWFLRQIVS